MSAAEIEALRREDERRCQEDAVQPTVVIVPVPPDFRHEEALLEVCELVIAQLKTGLPARECIRRLHGWMPGEGA